MLGKLDLYNKTATRDLSALKVVKIWRLLQKLSIINYRTRIPQFKIMIRYLLIIKDTLVSTSIHCIHIKYKVEEETQIQPRIQLINIDEQIPLIMQDLMELYKIRYNNRKLKLRTIWVLKWILISGLRKILKVSKVRSILLQQLHPLKQITIQWHRKWTKNMIKQLIMIS